MLRIAAEILHDENLICLNEGCSEKTNTLYSIHIDNVDAFIIDYFFNNHVFFSDTSFFVHLDQLECAVSEEFNIIFETIDVYERLRNLTLKNLHYLKKTKEIVIPLFERFAFGYFEQLVRLKSVGIDVPEHLFSHPYANQ